MSASAYATFEKPAPHVGVLPPAHVAEVRSAIRAGRFSAETVGVWAGLDMTVRIMIVMAACDQPGEADHIARQPWDSFSPTDQLAMASAARLIRDLLTQFAAVA